LFRAGREADGRRHDGGQTPGSPGQQANASLALAAGPAEARKPGWAGPTVRQVGSKNLFRKGDRWADSAVKPEDDAKARVIRQFSDDHFRLARSQKAELNQYLTFDEPVTVELGGQVYKIDPEPR
jgi:Ca-activated chloride channel family protein